MTNEDAIATSLAGVVGVVLLSFAVLFVIKGCRASP